MAGKSIPEQLAASIFALLPVGTATAFGERERYTNAAAPRVVAVPQGAPVIDQPDRHGNEGFATHGKNAGYGRQLLLRRFVMHWYCHGASQVQGDAVDFGPAEDLYVETLKAVRKLYHNAVRFSDERWLDQEEGKDGFVKYGCMIVFTTTFHIPVYAAPDRVVELQADPKIVTTITMNGEEV